MNYVKKTGFTKKTISDNLYILGFILYIILSVIETTMFSSHIPRKVYSLARIASMGIISFKIIAFEIYNLKQLILYSIFACCIFLVYVFSDYTNVIYLSIILLGAKDVSIKKIIKSYFVVVSILILITMISAKLGIIENLQFFRDDGKIRESFGAIYPTDFAAHIFYLILSYCYIKKSKVSYANVSIFILIALLLYKYCDTRLDSLSIIFISLTFLLVKFERNIKLGRISKFLLIYSLPIFAIISIGTTFIYKYNQFNPKLMRLNEILSGRLNLGSLGIDIYGFSLFGQQVLMKGNGGTIEKVSDYFFIDCSYLLIMLKNGVVFSLIICIAFVLSCKKNIDKGNMKLPIIVALIGINSMVAHHFLELAYNPFLVMIVTPLESEICKRNIKRIIKINFAFHKRKAKVLRV